MKTTKKSRSFLFLIEMLIVTVFFSLSSIVCVQLFVKAKSYNQQAIDLNNATMMMQSTVESLRSGIEVENVDWKGLTVTVDSVDKDNYREATIIIYNNPYLF